MLLVHFLTFHACLWSNMYFSRPISYIISWLNTATVTFSSTHTLLLLWGCDFAVLSWTKLNYTRCKDANLLCHRLRIFYLPLCSHWMEVNGRQIFVCVNFAHVWPCPKVRMWLSGDHWRENLKASSRQVARTVTAKVHNNAGAWGCGLKEGQRGRMG